MVTICIDYTDTFNPDIRAERLIEILDKESDEYILVGLSMGGYISLVEGESVKNKPRGIFLLAPALYLESYKILEFTPGFENIEVVNGWNDCIVPFENSVKFCQQNNFTLHLLNSDHGLMNKLYEIEKLFDYFLEKLWD